MDTRLNFNEIPIQKTEVSLCRESEWLKAKIGGEYEFDTKSRLEAEITFWRDSERVFIDACMHIIISLQCVRCLKLFPFDTRKKNSLLFFNSAEPSGGTGEVELTSDSIEEEYLAHGILDLEDVLAEQVILSLPDYPKCSERCKGLCPVCGNNLNIMDCGCRKKESHSAFSRLKNFFNK